MPGEGRDESAMGQAGVRHLPGRSAPCPAKDATRPQDSRQGRLMRAQLPAGATVMDPGSVFTAGAPGTLDGAKAGDGERGGSLSRLDEVMLFVAVCQRYGSPVG